MKESDIFLCFIAIIFPPLAVWIKRGVCSVDSLINILLCLFGVIPGLFHAWYIIAEYSDNGSKLIDAESAGAVIYAQTHRANNLAQVPNISHHTYPGYGTTNTVAHSGHAVDNGIPNNNKLQPNEGSGNLSMPPTYTEAVKGDVKIQTSK